MPNNKSDIGFLFDPRPFIDGITKIDRSLTAFENKIKASMKRTSDFIFKPLNMIGSHLKTFAQRHLGMFKEIDKGVNKHKENAQKASKGIKESMSWAVAKGQLMANAIMGITRASINMINQQIPEIGQAFGIASNIIFKNLFWPLRQQIVPMLQKMLNWVRDNRGIFLKLGMTISNLFSAGMAVGRAFMNALAPLWDSLKNLMGFGKGDWMDAINLALAKTSVVIQYIGVLLKGPLDFVKQLIDAVSSTGLLKDVINLAVTFGKIAWNSIISFFSGLAGWIKPAVSAFDGIVKSVDKIFKAVFGTNGNGLNDFFRFLGNATGWTISTLLEGLNQAMNGIASAIVWLKEVLEDMRHAIAGLPGGLLKGMDVNIPIAEAAARVKGGENISHFAGLGMDTGLITREMAKLHDGVIQGGRPVATDPKDVIIAHKGQVTVSKDSGAGGQGNWTVMVNVTEGNAKQAGMNFADGLQYQMRSLLAHEAMTGGH